MNKKFVIPGVLTYDTEEFRVITSDPTKFTANGSRILTLADPGPPPVPVTLAAIGSSPNVNAATLTGQQLNLEPASATFGGVVTTGAQTFAGLKTFSTGISAPGLITGLSAIGASPNANGALITGSNLALEPASATFGGVVTAGNQTFAGEKQFNSGLYLGPSQQLLNNYKAYDAIVGSITSTGAVSNIYIDDIPVANLLVKFIEIGGVFFMTIPTFSCDISVPSTGLVLQNITPFPHLTNFGNNCVNQIELFESDGLTLATGEIDTEWIGANLGRVIMTKYGSNWTGTALTRCTQTFTFLLL